MSDIAQKLLAIVVFALVGAIACADYDRRRKRLAATSAYWAARPTALQIVGMCVLAFGVMGLALHALPQRWPDWVRNYVGFGVLAAICWGELIRRRLWWWRKP